MAETIPFPNCCTTDRVARAPHTAPELQHWTTLQPCQLSRAGSLGARAHNLAGVSSMHLGLIRSVEGKVASTAKVLLVHPLDTAYGPCQIPSTMLVVVSPPG